MKPGEPCEKCKRPTPTQAQWDYEGPLHGNGNGCECAECAAMCWGDFIDCARARVAGAHGAVNLDALSKRGHLISAILDERGRQEKLKAEGRFTHTCAGAGITDDRCCVILTEEIGECARAIQENDTEQLKKELVQTAAVALAWLERLP